jgi:hypothetical protein
MKFLLKFIIVVVSFVLFSCVSDIANRYYGNEHYPAKDPKGVDLLMQKPTRPFFIIADFQMRGETPEGLRARAAEIGADAVIVTTLGGLYDKSNQWAGEDSKRGTYYRIIGTAIKYK